MALLLQHCNRLLIVTLSRSRPGLRHVYSQLSHQLSSRTVDVDDDVDVDEPQVYFTTSTTTSTTTSLSSALDVVEIKKKKNLSQQLVPCSDDCSQQLWVLDVHVLNEGVTVDSLAIDFICNYSRRPPRRPPPQKRRWGSNCK